MDEMFSGCSEKQFLEAGSSAGAEDGEIGIDLIDIVINRRDRVAALSHRELNIEFGVGLADRFEDFFKLGLQPENLSIMVGCGKRWNFPIDANREIDRVVVKNMKSGTMKISHLGGIVKCVPRGL